jgi:hypothetical protein
MHRCEHADGLARADGSEGAASAPVRRSSLSDRHFQTAVQVDIRCTQCGHCSETKRVICPARTPIATSTHFITLTHKYCDLFVCLYLQEVYCGLALDIPDAMSSSPSPPSSPERSVATLDDAVATFLGNEHRVFECEQCRDKEALAEVRV